MCFSRHLRVTVFNTSYCSGCTSKVNVDLVWPPFCLLAYLGHTLL